MAKMTAHDRRATIRTLQQQGYPLIPGNDYIPREWVPKHPASLDTVRRRLAKIKGSLAQTIADLREREG